MTKVNTVNVPYTYKSFVEMLAICPSRMLSIFKVEFCGSSMDIEVIPNANKPENNMPMEVSFDMFDFLTIYPIDRATIMPIGTAPKKGFKSTT